MAQGNTQTPKPRRPFVSTLMRFEWFADVPVPLNGTVPNNSQVQLPNNILPNDRFFSGLLFQYEARIVTPGAQAPTGLQADGAFALIDTIIVKGTHRLRGQNEVFISARGPDLRELARNYQSSAPNIQGTLVTGINQTVDLRFDIPLFFWPMQVRLEEKVDYLLDAPNYDALQVFMQVADDNNIFTYGARTAPTFTAFGSASGTPRIRVGGWYAQAGRHAFEGFVPGRVWRYFAEDTSADMTTTGANVRLANLNIPRGQRIRGILLKTGAKSTAVTSGNTSFNTLSNLILANVKAFRGTNKITRFFADFFQMQEDSRNAYAIAPSTGYGLIDYATNGTIHESLDLTGAAAGPTGDVDTYIGADVTGAANQATVALWEEIRGIPQYPVR